MSDLKLPATLMHPQANECLSQWVTQLRAQSASTAPVVLDASALHEFDSSALAVLMGLRREVLALGRTLSVQGMSARLRELATLYGVVDLLELN
ncbi:lipid asymmetry maintenance protein MlaB [Limnohabitans sp. DM1]|uniref:STAS domain-containing protein n=1 Tax=Limnohabitans sp. DM1 TaxID=1597955 RepID=UPI000AF2A47F|nr:STAS domain-containing protein [Limnohabitans sp. DM1]